MSSGPWEKATMSALTEANGRLCSPCSQHGRVYFNSSVGEGGTFVSLLGIESSHFSDTVFGHSWGLNLC